MTGRQMADKYLKPICRVTFVIKIKVREQRGLKKLNMIQIMQDWLDIGLLKKYILAL